MKVYKKDQACSVQHKWVEWETLPAAKVRQKAVPCGCHIMRPNNAMLAAAPAPAFDEAAERAAFEKFAEGHYMLQELGLEIEDGEYREPEMSYAWDAYLACAKRKAGGDL